MTVDIWVQRGEGLLRGLIAGETFLTRSLVQCIILAGDFRPMALQLVQVVL